MGSKDSDNQAMSDSQSSSRDARVTWGSASQGDAGVAATAVTRLRSLTAGKPTTAFFVPGRIEFLGKHTDYAGGRSLLCAVNRGFAIVASPRKDQTIRIVDPSDDSIASFELSSDITPTPGHWSNYAMTVARRIAMNFPGDLRGADIAFASDLPPSSGMSSSSALVVAFFLALSKVNRLPEHPAYAANIKATEDLAGYLGTVENGQSFGALAGTTGVGTFGGSEDHTAILCSQPNALRQYSFCPVRLERTIPFPADHVLVVAVSGVIAEKTGAAREKYNAVSLSVQEILKRWRAATGRGDTVLADAIASDPGALDRLRKLLAGDRLIGRLEQFVAESMEIIPAAGDALAAGRLDDLGKLVDRSQETGARLLGNQIPETIFLAKSARDIGAIAASAFGAGFGGSVWAMVRADEAAEFLERWKSSYVAQFPQQTASSNFFVTCAGFPATDISNNLR
jgi:galactokinase